MAIRLRFLDALVKPMELGCGAGSDRGVRMALRGLLEVRLGGVAEILAKKLCELGNRCPAS